MTTETIPQHEFLLKPILYFQGLPASVTDEELMRIFTECLRARFVRFSLILLWAQSARPTFERREGHINASQFNSEPDF